MWMPSQEILHVWRSFDEMCMETLTKVWCHKHQQSQPRTVAAMEADFRSHGACGNCFDLAQWLSHRFDEAGIESYKVSNNILSRDAHVAVIAIDRQGHHYLCDLGDMWLMPVRVDLPTTQLLGGYFPAAKIEVQPSTHHLSILYHRPNGQCAQQSYDLSPIDDETWAFAAKQNHQYLAQLLVECRDISAQAHWEFTAYTSQWSTVDGLCQEVDCQSLVDWARRIGVRTMMDVDFVLTCLEYWAHKID